MKDETKEGRRRVFKKSTLCLVWYHVLIFSVYVFAPVTRRKASLWQPKQKNHHRKKAYGVRFTHS